MFTKAQEEISRDTWAARPAAEAAPGAGSAASGAAGPTAWMAYQQDCTPTSIEAAYTIYLAQAKAAGAAQEDRAVWVAKHMMELAAKHFAVQASAGGKKRCLDETDAKVAAPAGEGDAAMASAP